MNRRNVTKPLLIIILLHAFWFAAGMIWQHFYNGDSYEYIYLAENIKHGYYYGANPLLPANDFRMTLRTPVYSIILLLFYTLFGYNNWIILLAQNILSIASCCLILNIFQKINPTKKYSWIYLLFIAFYPGQMFFATTLAPDTLLQFFLMLYVRQLILSLTQINTRHIGLMSLWLILAVLTKPIVYPFLFLHFIYAIWYVSKTKAKTVLLTGALPIFIMLGYGLWNKERTGLFHISSIQSTNLLHYNVRFFLNAHYNPEYADSVLTLKSKEQNALTGLKPKYEYASREASAIIKEHLWSYGIFHLRESMRFFIEPGKSELDLYTGYMGYNFDANAPNFYKNYRERGIAGAWDYLRSYPWLPVVLLVLFFNILRLIGWLFFLFSKKIPLAIRLCTTVYILYFAAVTGPVANARYFLPVLPVLSAIAMIGYAIVLDKRLDKRKNRHYA